MTEPPIRLSNRKFQVLLISILGIIIYSNTFNAPFIFDDFLYIANNNDVLKDFGYFIEPSKIEDVMHQDTLVSYTFKSRFIGFLTFAINYRLHNLDVTGYHVFNLTIHLINGLLVYWLVILTFRTPFFSNQLSAVSYQQKETPIHSFASTSGGSPIHPPELIWRASPFTYLPLFIALLFVSHPIQTQAVTYISQRFTSLATFFYLLSVVMYIEWRLVNRPSAISHQPSADGTLKLRISLLNAKCYMLYAASLLSAILAMKTKEISFTLPIVITLYEFIFLSGRFKRRILYLLPFILTMLIIPIGIMGIDKPAGEVIAGVDEATRAKTGISRSDYLFTEFRVILTYIRLLFFPVNQNLDYDYPIYHSFSNPNVFLSFLFLASIFGLGVYLLIKGFKVQGLKGLNNQPSIFKPLNIKLISFGIFWFFITLSVESSIIPTQDVIFEHRMYLPSIGIIIVFSTVAFYVLQFSNSPIHSPLSALRRIRRGERVACGDRFPHSLFPVYCAAALIIVLSIATYQRNIIWNDDVVLWKDVIKKSPQKPRSYHELGLVYLNRDMLDEAIMEFETAIRLKPDYFLAHKNLSVVYYKKGMYDETIREIQITLMLGENKKEVAYGNIGAIYLKKGLTDKAIEYLEYALKLNPEYAAAYHNLGIAYSSKGWKQKAIEYFNKAHMLDPDRYPERITDK